jgi:hypothetical protein
MRANSDGFAEVGDESEFGSVDGWRRQRGKRTLDRIEMAEALASRNKDGAEQGKCKRELGFHNESFFAVDAEGAK